MPLTRLAAADVVTDAVCTQVPVAGVVDRTHEQLNFRYGRVLATTVLGELTALLDDDRLRLVLQFANRCPDIPRIMLTADWVAGHPLSMSAVVYLTSRIMRAETTVDPAKPAAQVTRELLASATRRWSGIMWIDGRRAFIDLAAAVQRVRFMCRLIDDLRLRLWGP